MIILGISTDSRVIGVAVLQKDVLLDFNVHYFQEAWSESKAYRILGCLNQYFKRYPVTHIAIAIPYEYYQNKETKALIKLIQKHSLKKNLELITFQPESIHYFHQDTKAKKKAMMEGLTILYPELLGIHKKELRNKRRYYIKLFEAVAVARLLHLETESEMSK